MVDPSPNGTESNQTDRVWLHRDGMSLYVTVDGVVVDTCVGWRDDVTRTMFMNHVRALNAWLDGE